MVIGIKYCGGCNPRYDRVAQVEQLKRTCPQHTYVTTAYGDTCDVWLVVCGCTAACADRTALKASKRLFLITSGQQFAEAADWIREQA